MKQPLIEGCVDSYASAVAAVLGGADRLELCANLAIGGTTPSPALFKQVQRDCDVKINVLIRPRFGDFLYSEPEMEEMCTEIQAFHALGANGAVIGVLTPEGDLDEEKMRRLTACAGDMEITLHRAFDMTHDPFAALETAVQLGCTTILTSGQAPSAPAGRELLRELFLRAKIGKDALAQVARLAHINDLAQRVLVQVHPRRGRYGGRSGTLHNSLTRPATNRYFFTYSSEYLSCTVGSGVG